MYVEGIFRMRETVVTFTNSCEKDPELHNSPPGIHTTEVSDRVYIENIQSCLLSSVEVQDVDLNRLG